MCTLYVSFAFFHLAVDLVVFFYDSFEVSFDKTYDYKRQKYLSNYCTVNKFETLPLLYLYLSLLVSTQMRATVMSVFINYSN